MSAASLARRARTVLVAALALGLVAVTSAQGGRRGGFGGLRSMYDPQIHNLKYDGRFTFLRLKYDVGPGGYYYYGLPAWGHGLEPDPEDNAEANLMRILDAITAVHPRLDGSNIIGLDDPELFKYPVAYMTEAGYWEMSDTEARHFGQYLRKGGFVIFDDFRAPPRGGGGWEQFEDNMRRVLPGARIVDMTPRDPIFHMFFDIDSFSIIPQAYDGPNGPPIIRGIYEDNDPSKRLMAIINFNTDVSQYWEFSGEGMMPVADANEAYELGVNYVLYGLTH